MLKELILKIIFKLFLNPNELRKKGEKIHSSG